MKTVWLGLSITSSWGNGHATNYRGLLAALAQRGHEVLFLERDVPWYAATRDFSAPFVRLYRSLDELAGRHDDVRDADLVVVGSYVPDGCDVAEWVLGTAEGVTAFWDIDTPVTAAKLGRGDHEYLSPGLVPRFDLYLSFTGGPFLATLGARRPTPFYCVADPALYRPLDVAARFELGYLGTYSQDRQPKVDELLLTPARARPESRFALAGPQYPEGIDWPANVERLDSLPPAKHPAFYASQRFTLNVTRADMVAAGWSPSVRLFEAAACGAPVISDWWDGLDAFFEPGHEILVAGDADDVLRHLRHGDRAVGHRARERVLAAHTADHRAAELEDHVARVREGVPV
ncbi:MAG TPA: glycosyltransferase [Gaiellaceae bacterium]|nr:glycosyltransferase [Gaiellaceae bacterium]